MMNPAYNPFQVPGMISSYDRINMQMMGGQNPSPSFPANQTNITFVNGYNEAVGFQVGTNSNVLLMDANNSKFYVKSTDSLGVPKISIYSFAEDTPVQQEVVQPQGIDFAGMVDGTVKALEDKVANLEGKLAELAGKLGESI